MRGEYTTRSGATFVNLELPPRARRIRHPCPTPANHQGTTSACAENTRLSLYHRRSSWNYLRVRGEYRIPPQLRTLRLELPPRARRIPSWPIPVLRDMRTTSACAENTGGETPSAGKTRNYLRVRGEYVKPPTSPPTLWELPPRARRIRATQAGVKTIDRTTSACAENTSFPTAWPPQPRNYLRVRGEYTGRH